MSRHDLAPLLALTLVLASPIAAGEGPPDPCAAARVTIPYRMRTLPNGLVVVVHEDRSTPVASVNTWYHVGSGRETPGRTGLAHFFEHVMFGGSANVPEGMFDRWLEAAGGDNNGSTDSDRTNYFEDVPSNAVELALFLEADRMATLASVLTKERMDQQRDVVKNERRQAYENAPYGMAPILLAEALFPEGHPYRWPTIGSMEDLSAATAEDARAFFRNWYGPANASVVIAGDVEPEAAFAMAARWFGEIPPGTAHEPPAPRPVKLEREKRLVLEDDVELPRLYLSWPLPHRLAPAIPALESAAAILADGKSSRLYRRLVYELAVALDVSADVFPGALASTFDVTVTARPGHGLSEVARLVDEEVARLAAEPPSEREVARAANQWEAALLSGLERVGGFGGKADTLNSYLVTTGNPDYAAEDLAAHRAVAPSDVSLAAATWLGAGRASLSVVPKGKRDLALPEVAK
ncbi:MAG: insulinase family protein [Acidobacteria bacterium]|nr:MAG: insulinase family protein [Acidobacteriota bacterium]MCE7959740.1 insulinase family protein [Acidobacteria bacterium ACB2]